MVLGSNEFTILTFIRHPRFWRVKMVVTRSEKEEEEEEDASSLEPAFEWEEWQMESARGDSAISVNGRPVSVGAAYSGRVAVAYQTGASFQKKKGHQQQQQQQRGGAGVGDPKLRYVNLCVDIYECESTGGAEWIREDTIALRNIELQPEMPDVDVMAAAAGAGKDGAMAARLAQHFGAVSGAVDEGQDAEERRRNIRGGRADGNIGVGVGGLKL